MTDIRRNERPHGIRLDLPAAHSAGRMARQIVRQFVTAEGVPEQEIERIEFVAGELLDNAVDHGGGGGAREVTDLPRDVRMSLSLDVSDGGWTIAVGDQGGAQLESVRLLIRPADGFPDLEDERGRGFFLLGQMVDELDVEETEDGLGLSFRASRRYRPPREGAADGPDADPQ